MNDAYKKVLEWYKLRPKWQKIVFFVFIAVAVVFLFLLSLASRIPLPPNSKMNKKLEDVLESNFEDHKKRTEKESEEIDQIIEDKTDEVEWIEEEESKEMEEARNVKKEIDSADSIDDIDRAVERYYGRKQDKKD